MKHIIVTSEELARKLEQTVSSLKGYPQCHCGACGGLEVGGGVHAPHGIPITERDDTIRQHPKLEKFAYPISDSMVKEVQDGVSVLEKNGQITKGQATTITEAIALSTELDVTWEDTEKHLKP